MKNNDNQIFAKLKILIQKRNIIFDYKQFDDLPQNTFTINLPNNIVIEIKNEIMNRRKTLIIESNKSEFEFKGSNISKIFLNDKSIAGEELKSKKYLIENYKLKDV